MGKTMAEVLMERGEAKGEARGIKKGLVMAKQEDLIRLIKGRFGSVPGSIAKKIKLTKKTEKLDMLFDLAISADTIDDLISGLEK